MPALTFPETWRSGKPYSAKGYAFILQPEIVFAAQVNMPSVTYPATALAFDNVTTGAYTAIQPGMTLWMGSTAGAYDLGITRVRSAATTVSIPIGRTPKGDHPGELNITDDAYISVVNLREVWAKIPYISSTGVSKKDEISYNSTIAQPPIANGGPAVAQFIAAGESVISVDFTAALSQVVDPGASILTYSWNFDDGTPSTSTSATPTGVTFPAGFRYVSLTVNDGTRSHTTYIPVYAAERSGSNAPIPVTGVSRALKPEGQTLSFTIQAQDVDIADYPPSTLVIYFEEERYGASDGSLAGTTGRENVKFVGWADTEQTRIQMGADGRKSSVSMTCLDVAGWLAKRPGFGQIVVRKTTPTKWEHMKSANINRYIHYLLHWHSTALSVAPFTWSADGDSYVFKSLQSDGANLFNQVSRIATAIAYRLTCTSRGELGLYPDPQRQAVASRTSTEIVTLAETDWFNATYEQAGPRIHWLHGSAVIASATQAKAAFCIAPGTSPGQGESDQEVGSQLVLNAQELRVRTGHDYARLNARETSFTIQLTHGGDAGFEPALMEWVTFSISAAVAAQRGVTIAEGERFLLLGVGISHDDEGQTNKVNLQIEREVIGFEAIAVIPPTPASTSPSIPPLPTIPPVPMFPPPPDVIYPPPGTYPLPTPPVTVPADGNAVLLWTNDDRVLVTQQFRQTNNPTWSDISPTGVSGVVESRLAVSGKDAYVLGGSLDSGWEQTFDFSLGSDEGWYPTPASGNEYAAWDGTGFAVGDYTEPIIISLVFSGIVTGFSITLDSELPSDYSSNQGTLYRGDAISNPPSVVRQNNGAGTTYSVDITETAVTGFTLGVDASHATSEAVVNTSRIVSVTLRGTGENPFGGDWTQTFDFTTGKYGWDNNLDTGGTFGAWALGTGWSHTDDVDTVSAPDIGARAIFISRAFTSSTITGITVIFNYTKGTFDFTAPAVFISVGGVTVISINNTAMSDGNGQSKSWTGSQAGGLVEVYIRASRDQSLPYAYSGAVDILQIIVTGEGDNPFSSGQVFYTDNAWAGNVAWSNGEELGTGYNLLAMASTLHNLFAYASSVAAVKLSTDDGETWGSEVSVGTTPGSIAGGDAVRIGNASLFAADQQVMKASSLGGAYSAYGSALTGSAQPYAICIPKKAIGSTSDNSSSSPDYIVASDAVDGSGDSIWKVTSAGATATAITPTIGGFVGLAVSPRCVAMSWWSGSKIAAILEFDGVRHLVTSSNAGTSWTDCGAVGDTADCLKMRKGDRNAVELYYVDGAAVIFSPDFGVTLYEKSFEGNDTTEAAGVEVYG